MTSRDATGLLPRHEAVARGVRRKSAGDWAHIVFYFAIGWPWLLRSLSGGSRKERAALLARLDLPTNALPHLGSWKADVGFLNLIVDTVLETKPQTIVELGAGATTMAAARALTLTGGGRLFSIDGHADFVDATGKWLADFGLAAELQHAPLTKISADWPGRWYDHGALPARIDLLIIDGPHWGVHPFVRGAADSLFERIPEGGVILLDDASRPGERVVASRWRRRWPDFEFELRKSGAKGALVGRRKSVAQTAPVAEGAPPRLSVGEAA